MAISFKWWGRNDAVMLEAQRLLTSHGPMEAWQEARTIALSAPVGVDQDFAWKVLREVERRRGMKWQAGGGA